jgi:hypothetical protein
MKQTIQSLSLGSTELDMKMLVQGLKSVKRKTLSCLRKCFWFMDKFQLMMVKAPSLAVKLGRKR